MVGLVVHEWVAPTGGSENVVDEFLRTFPDADVFALWNDAGGRFGATLQESWIARTPLRRSKAAALPLMPPTWRRLPGRQPYDWMLVSSHLFAHHARVPSQPGISKFVYAHTPARYVWEPSLDKRGSSVPVRIASAVLKPLDKRRAKEASDIAANSEFTRERIQRTWGREARVIYPPVDIERIRSVEDWSTRLSGSEAEVLAALPAQFLLGASRLVPYKRLDRVIDVGVSSGMPVVLAGAGPDERRLRELASKARIPVTFLGRPSDSLLLALYQRAFAFVFPAIEDFGIMPVEAISAGARLITDSRGGAAESTRLLQGGVTVTDWDDDQMRDAVTAIEQVDVPEARSNAWRFSAERFRAEIAEWLEPVASAS